MDKNAIKKYAIWAREELIKRITQKALEYGITENEIVDANIESINGKLLSGIEKNQRKELIKQIETKGFNQVIEEVAYTWFNRFCALRFMEVNGYLPSHVRVFTDDENNFNPQILTEAIYLDMEGMDIYKVYEYKENNKIDELYKYLLIVQCNVLNRILPGVFQKIKDYTELLLPDNLLHDGSVIKKMIEEIPEDNFGNGNIEIIGWLYQYYILKKRKEVVDPLHSKVIQKNDIPAATQLFTTDWIVRYIIDNSLGRYWIERNPGSKLKNDLEYFVESKEKNLTIIDEIVDPKELTVFDPCMGSAHFLVYAFDVLIKIYEECGYSQREAAKNIVEKNLYGLDIDGRASQMAYFAIMMRACEYDARFLNRKIKPNLYEIKDSNCIDSYYLKYFINDDENLEIEINKLVSSFFNAKEYGSIMNIMEMDFDLLYKRVYEIKQENNIYSEIVLKEINPFIQIAEIISNKYTIVITNPPYLNKYSKELKEYVKDNYKDYSTDLFSIFIYKNLQYCKQNGYSGMMTPNTWIFLKSYEELRNYIIENKSIITLIQMAKGAFFKEASVDVCTFVLRNNSNRCKGLYIKLLEFKGDMNIQQKKFIESLYIKDCNYFFEISQDYFLKLPGHTISYWIDRKALQAYTRGILLGDIALPKTGMTTGDNNRFLRLWSEINIEKVNLNANSSKEAEKSRKKWFPYCKGGGYKRWYGFNEYVVNWENNGFEIKNNIKNNGRKAASIRSENLYFKKLITWSSVTSGKFSCRMSLGGALFDSGGSSILIENNMLYILGLLNSTIGQYYLDIRNETINYQPGDIANIPILMNKIKEVELIVKENIKLSKEDWDSFEVSWDFDRSPMIEPYEKISDVFNFYKQKTKERFRRIKLNEERLNSIFIDMYDLSNKLNYTIEDKYITIHKAELQSSIKELISYSIGCMFGRYSLNIGGVVYAGGEWSKSKYKTFKPDKDNIIPICDDEYFKDDIVGKFIEFIEIVYGSDTLEENLKFISDTLGGRGTPREVIRNYFIKDFYTDHCKMYKKRPIYWLFDSGKKNGFKALMYMHRYQPDTIARLRTDYVHEQQARYRNAIESIEKNIENASRSEKVKLTKKLNKLKDQEIEIREYEEKVHHLADQMISIDLDDGVKHNYEIFKDILAKIK